MVQRKTLSKKLRFEVFKRDSFTCQYCGRSAPDVILHADHIEPVSKGGEDDLLNLVTSCKDCNLGKSNRELSDDAVLRQRKQQLDILQERREQLEMLMEWQRSLIDLESQAQDELANLWSTLCPGFQLNDNGLTNLKKWLGKFSAFELAESMRKATAQYLEYKVGDEKPTQASADTAFLYVPKIANIARVEKEKPYIRDLLYIRGILRNRLSRIDYDTMAILEQAVRNGVNTEDIKLLAKQSDRWWEFEEALQELVKKAANR